MKNDLHVILAFDLKAGTWKRESEPKPRTELFDQLQAIWADNRRARLQPIPQTAAKAS